MSGQKILIVDDDAMTRRMLDEMLRLQSYDLFEADGGGNALRQIEAHHPDLILLDLVMPDMDGYEVASRVRADPKTSHMAIVMITGRDVSQEKIRALEAGADDLLSKPILMAELLARVRTALSAKAYRDRLENERSVLEAEVARQTSELRRAAAEVEAASLEIVRRLARAAEFRDDSTGSHVDRVSRSTEVIAREMGLPPEECRVLRLAASMHDVGKIGVPDEVLRKSGSLDPRETTIMRQHTDIGEQILHGSSLDLVRMAATIALHHHEWWNGKGYPRGIGGTDIPLPARIVAVADALDAMTSIRPYRTAVGTDKAFAEIEALAGVQFDPEVVRAAVRARRELEAIRAAYPIQG